MDGAVGAGMAKPCAKPGLILREWALAVCLQQEADNYAQGVRGLGEGASRLEGLSGLEPLMLLGCCGRLTYDARGVKTGKYVHTN